ncbi:MAG: septation protein A [Azospirillaceae bacterium]
MTGSTPPETTADSKPAHNTQGADTVAADKPGLGPFARLAVEAGPLVVFFVVNRLEGIMAGTGAFMAATLVSVVLSHRLDRRLPLMPLISCGFVMLFGGLTLALDDALFIKIKPTVVNLLFAAVLGIGLALKRPFLKMLMGAMIELDDQGWRVLTLRWAVFFVVLAVLNEIVWRSMSTDAWVNFKVFALMPLTLLFGLANVPLIMRHQLGGADGARAREAAAEQAEDTLTN